MRLCVYTYAARLRFFLRRRVFPALCFASIHPVLVHLRPSSSFSSTSVPAIESKLPLAFQARIPVPSPFLTLPSMIHLAPNPVQLQGIVLPGVRWLTEDSDSLSPKFIS
ncbi:hypothetical protein C8R47DRAFT_1209964 [Mycena vitilis]|nr:hypothetical protein C8R47DRAFT_1209964 [Mycena vitilis]